MDSMTSMSGSEIARLVLGYLQSQRTDEKAWNKLALDFCKLNKTYLREEYNLLSRGIKLKYVSKPRTLVDIFREFIEIEEIVNGFFETELKRHDEIPSELLGVHSLKEKVQYACRMFNLAGDSSESSQSHLTRKRPNVCIYQSEYDSDSSANVSPDATNVEDLPGYTHPPSKRRKIFDPSLIISNRKENIRLDDNKSDWPKATPLKSSVTQVPMSSKHLQASASKVVIPGKEISDSFLANEYQTIIAQRINSVFDNSNVSLVEQVNDKMGGIVNSIQPTFDDIINNLGLDIYDVQSLDSSSSISKHEFDVNESASESRQLDTPVPNDANRSGRYELRSQNKRIPALNASIETKRKKNGKAEIISDERVNILPEITVQPGSSPILVDSDSEGAVTTTSQQQSQLPFPQGWFLFQDAQGQYYVSDVAPTTTLSYDTQQSQQSTASLNMIDPSQIINPSNQLNMKIVSLENSSNPNASNQCAIQTDLNQAASSDEVRDRIIEINTDDVNKEGTQPVQITQQPSEEMKEAVKKQSSIFEQLKEKSFSQFKQISEQKVVTPKQLIRPNIPGSSRSLSTPRNKNPHVRVLDFNTPTRFRLSEILEGKNESFINTSRFSSETPQNRSITSSMPSSAPPKVNSVIQSEKKSDEKLAESSTAEPFVPTNEDTVVSAEGETPKLRKVNRRSVVRTISERKEINPEENEKRLKRVAKTKKKICPEEGDSNESDTNNKKEVAKEPVSKEDALAEWQRIRSARNNPELFEQNLREQNSKRQEIDISTGKKKRQRRTKKKPVAKAKQAAKAILDESAKSVDISMNSSLDPDLLNSTETNMEAQMLEDMLKSAKKVTPMKQEIIPKSTKKKTPIGKLQIKLMPSPKNKAFKRLKSKKNLTSTQTSEDVKKDEPVASCSTTENPTETEAEPKPENKIQKQTESEPVKPIENTTDVVEVAQNLISMRDVILQQESQRKQAQQSEIQSDSVSMSQPTFEVALFKTNSEPMPVKFDSDLLKYVSQGNLSLSNLLETPYKDGMQIFPKTPGITSLLSTLNTPMLRPVEFFMGSSVIKDSKFLTPNMPITPGSGFTPVSFKDIISPRSDQELIYGAANRPTDYSSSSSYYKPDESDGIDKHIQASLQTTRTNSGVYSTDEIDDSKVDDTTQNTMNSSSSSSSSSDSDSDSDSDSSSSSDSETSQISLQSMEKEPQPVERVELSQPVERVEPSPPKVVDEDSTQIHTQIIKSHLVSSSEVNIARNILLTKPEEPILNEEAERLALLEEKKRRMQETLRGIEMKNHEKFKPPKKVRTIAEVTRDRIQSRLRKPLVTVSPSKRKSTQPKKIVPIHSRQIYSDSANVISTPMEIGTEVELKVQSVNTERLIPEAASDNAIADASDVSTTRNPQSSPKDEEESVEAIKSHINKSPELVDTAGAAPIKEAGGSKKTSTEDLIATLSEKQKKFDANRPKMKTEVIAALPLSRTTRSRTKNLTSIRPARNIITAAPPSSAKGGQKATANAKEKRKSKESVPGQPVKKVTNETAKKELTKEEASSKMKETFETPAKEKQKRLAFDIFGNCSDIETPIKSPPKIVAKPKENPVARQRSSTPPKEPERESNKFEADSSNVKDEDEADDDDDDDDSSEEEDFEMCMSIDETDKKRFFSIRETASFKPRAPVQGVTFGTQNIVVDCLTIHLAPSEEIELYTQDVDSVAEMNKERQQRRSTMEVKEGANNVPTSSSEAIYGKPLHTSTPSPPKTVTPKFNIKHKPSDTVSPKSAKRQNKDDLFNGIQMSIDDVLSSLHPNNT